MSRIAYFDCVFASLKLESSGRWWSFSFFGINYSFTLTSMLFSKWIISLFNSLLFCPYLISYRCLLTTCKANENWSHSGPYKHARSVLYQSSVALRCTVGTNTIIRIDLSATPPASHAYPERVRTYVHMCVCASRRTAELARTCRSRPVIILC